LAAALTLAGCGRKGDLDPPPMAAAGDTRQPAPQGQAANAPPPAAAPATVAQPAPDKRKTFLDWLID
jgi:hypothetical protein